MGYALLPLGPPVNVTCNIFINSFGSVTETTMVRGLPVPHFHSSVSGEAHQVTHISYLCYPLPVSWSWLKT